MTDADYRRVMDRFARDLASLGEDMVSVYLYGSVARGNLRPGRSDVGDAYVFLRQRVLENRDSFLGALHTMAEAVRTMARSGLPSHAFHYFGDGELRYIVAGALATLRSERESRLRAGHDLQARFVDPVPVDTGMHEMLREWGYPLARYLARDELTHDERQALATGVDDIRKYVPLWACAAAHEPAAGEEAVRTLERLFPDVDLSVLHELEELRRDSANVPGTAELRHIVRKCLVLIEELHLRIVQPGRS